MIFAAFKMLTTNTSKCIQTLDQMIIYKATKHQPRIIQTPTLNHRKITTDILDGIPTSFKQHPTACSKSSTHHRTTSHISSKSQPRTTQTSTVHSVYKIRNAMTSCVESLVKASATISLVGQWSNLMEPCSCS